MFTILFTVFPYLLYGVKINSSSPPHITEKESYVIAGLAITTIGFMLWSFVLNVIGTMYIQNFGIGKALANILIPAIVFVAIIYISFGRLLGL
ncbi:MAG: hypothetical protein HRT67_05100 [Flavobacteriaceae bacterium]|nr:hypothetical protein [Flavobacteriaceae bacterium]